MQLPTCITYTIMGTPEGVIKATKMSRVVQDDYNIRRYNYIQQLTNQHNEQPLLTGIWDLQAVFLFNDKHNNRRPHGDSPSLLNLFRFFDEIARGVIYSDSCIIQDLVMFKTYENVSPQSYYIFTKAQR